jgi:lysozyme
MEIKGIDISHWNGSIDFNKVKAQGIEFVIMKAGQTAKDPMFETYYKEAKAAGLKVGCYFFAPSNFYGSDKGEFYAKRLLKYIEGKQFEYPVFLDLEATDTQHRDQATDACISFLEYLEDKKYFVGIYASDISGFKNRLNDSRLKPYTHWVASYSCKPRYVKEYGIYQYTSKGSLQGIVGSVDMDISYIDYGRTIVSKGFNGYKSKKQKEVK